MNMETSEIGLRKSFVIGPILVDPSRNTLSRESDIVSLEPKIMDVLMHLAAHQGEVRSRDEIIAAVWKVEFGADESLTRAISVIRKAFKTAGGQSRYIQTISKRGYALQEPVTELEISPPERIPTTASPIVRDIETPATAFVSQIAVNEVNPSEVGAQPLGLTPPKQKKGRGLALILAPIIVTVAAISAAVMSRPEPFGTELAASEYGRSVAVMPFVDMSAEGSHRYFSEGLAEDISNELGSINSLRVVGQRIGGAADYTTMSYEEIGDRLRVSYIVHGSVRKQNDLVRITAQLINTEDNSHAWSSTYDGTLKNVFELQDRVANDVMTELSLMFGVTFFLEPIELEGLSPSALVPQQR
jgi:TolB-like protein/DNA-binding winged helix-turn-helix (wHTH) protein